MHPHLPYWLAAFYLVNVGSRSILSWLQQAQSIEALMTRVWREPNSLMLSVEQREAFKKLDWRLVEADLAWAQQAGNQLICFEDATYPTLLKEIADPPLILFTRGEVANLSSPQLAIVGSRQATFSGLKHADHFAQALVEAGLTVTSGLALGIDGASHRGALKAMGKTIAVLGTGLSKIYPKQHRQLWEEILNKGGTILSEFPLSMPPIPMHFPRRNRIISGLSMGVLVVEAALKSGSLITAKHAIDQGREVFAIPGPIAHPLSQGCHSLIRQGAKLVEQVADILEELSSFHVLSDSRCSPRGGKEILGLSAEYVSVLALIGQNPASLDAISCQSGLTVSALSSILLSLELAGHIQLVPGGYVKTF